jgi:protein arginine kinase activator
MDEKKMCSVCKTKPATVFFTNVSSENKFVNLNLCDDCAKAKGFNDPTSFAMADLMLGLGAAQEIEQAVGLELKCPRCGFSQADFKKSGRLGCPECYATFAEGLAGLLKTMHKGTRHIGKAPEALRATRESAGLLKTLQAKLAKAIKDENYEQAALVRDEIKQLTGRPTPTNLTR